MEFKGCVTDDKQRSHQELTESEVTDFVKDLQKMVPDSCQKCVDWDQTRTEQWNGPTKTVVSMWFRNETNLPTMVGMLDITKKNSRRCPKRLHGQEICARLEMSPKRKPLARAHALFYKTPQVGGDESKIHVFYGKISISFFVEGATAAKFTPEGDGLAGEGWSIINHKSSLRFVLIPVRLSLKPLFIQADARVVFSDSSLTARLAPGS